MAGGTVSRPPAPGAPIAHRVEYAPFAYGPDQDVTMGQANEIPLGSRFVNAETRKRPGRRVIVPPGRFLVGNYLYDTAIISPPNPLTDTLYACTGGSYAGSLKGTQRMEGVAVVGIDTVGRQTSGLSNPQLFSINISATGQGKPRFLSVLDVIAAGSVPATGRRFMYRLLPGPTGIVNPPLAGVMGSQVVDFRLLQEAVGPQACLRYYIYPHDSALAHSLPGDFSVAQGPTPQGPWTDVTLRRDSSNRIPQWVDTRPWNPAQGTYFCLATRTSAVDAQALKVYPDASVRFACGFPGNVKVKIRNNGIQPLTNAQAVIRLDGSLIGFQGFTQPIAPGRADSALVPLTITLGAPGAERRFSVRVSAPGDQNLGNDSASWSVISSLPLPLHERFDTIVPRHVMYYLSPLRGWDLSPGGYSEIDYAQGPGTVRYQVMNMVAGRSGLNQVTYLGTPALVGAGPATTVGVVLARVQGFGRADTVFVDASDDCWVTSRRLLKLDSASLGLGRSFGDISPSEFHTYYASLGLTQPAATVAVRVGIKARRSSNGVTHIYMKDLRVFDTSLVAIRQSRVAGSVRAVPNPAQASLTLSGLSGKALVILYDLTGRQALSQAIEPGQPITVGHLPRGLYRWMALPQQGGKPACGSLVIE